MRIHRLTALAALPLLGACVNTPPVVAIDDDAGSFTYGDGAPPFPDDSGVATGDGAALDGSAARDGSSPTDATTESDAGSNGDASQAKDASAEPDAAKSDAGPAAGPITVIVTTATGPEPGVSVLFHDATGAVVATETTDANGSASEDADAGGGVQAITAVLGTQLSPSLVSIFAVEPGDVLTVLDTTVPPAGSDDTVVANAPGSAPASTTQYAAFAGPCGSSDESSSVDLSLGVGCVAGGSFPLLALAEDQNSSELAYAYQKTNAVADAGTGPTGGAEIEVTIPGPWATAGSTSVSVANVPTTVSQGYIAYGEVVGGIAYEQYGNLLGAEGVPNDAGLPTAPFLAHTGYPDFIQVETNALLYNNDVQGGTNSGNTVVAVATRSSVSAPVTSIDLAMSLPLIVSGSLSYADPTRPTVSWSTSSPTQTSAGSASFVSWQTTEPDAATQTGTWLLISPPTQTTVQAPSLGSLAAWGPPDTGASIDWQPPLLAMFNGTFLSGYASLRAASASVWSPTITVVQNGYPQNQALVPPLPANGTLEVSAYFPTQE